MTEPRDRYLLPCSCGRNVIVQTRQAGETVRCECGRDCAVPRLVEIRRLRPVEVPAAVVRRSWGGSQRFLVGGVALMFVAGMVAGVLYWQYPSNRGIDRFVHGDRQQILALKPWTAIEYYRHSLAPGIETAADTGFQSYRERLGIGLVLPLIGLAVGAVLAGVGVVGLARGRRAASGTGKRDLSGKAAGCRADLIPFLSRFVRFVIASWGSSIDFPTGGHGCAFAKRCASAQRLRVFLPLLRSEAVAASRLSPRVYAHCFSRHAAYLESCGCCASGGERGVSHGSNTAETLI